MDSRSHRLAAVLDFARKADLPAVYSHATARRQATPCWADRRAIARIYAQARALGLTVDHVLPLRGSRVSGLHVPENLCLVTQSENSVKGNRYKL